MDGYNVNPHKIDDDGVTPFPEGDLHLFACFCFIFDRGDDQVVARHQPNT